MVGIFLFEINRNERGKSHMNPVRFPEQNCTYTAEGCFDLPVYSQMNKQFGVAEYISCWQLTDQDLALILQQMKAGQRPTIYLSVVSSQPPVAMWLKE